jgi:serine/threonine protein kinase/tetratricopeptide (TPR) repeat protein
MEAARWRRITKLYHAAVAHTPDERASFLGAACAGDEQLRREVELLVRSADSSDDFIELPAYQSAPELLLDDDPEKLIGQPLSHFKINALIAKGGMGEVYAANDEWLGRKVSLKLLRKELTTDPALVQQLHEEACTASALNHPNIVTIHEFGEVDGTQYIATEFVEGVTLRERIAQGRLPIEEALEIGIQVASSLAAAHGAGIVHRDVKPENIMLRPDGYVKVLDFGIAKLTEQQHAARGRDRVRQTHTGMVMGTAHYMSPEQARGLAVDARADIWSFGVVLYEMVAGYAPFEADTPTEVIAAVLLKEPLPMPPPPPDVPADFQRIIAKALRKNTTERYQTAAELLTDLRRLKDNLVPLIGVGRQEKRLLPFVATSVAGTLLVSLAAFYLHQPRGLTNTSQPPPAARSAAAIPATSIAVLPFDNLSDDQQQTGYFAAGVHEEILTALAKIGDLRVISRTSVMHFKDGPKHSLPEIAQALRVSHVLHGSVQRAGSRVRVTAHLIDARDDAERWAERYDRDVADIFAIQSDIAKSIAGQLQVAFSPRDEAAMRTKPTEDIVAYDLYLRALTIDRGNAANGVVHMSDEIALLEQAIARDPAFVPALCLLARAHLNMYWFNEDHSAARLELAKTAIDAAARVQPDGGEVHLARALLYYWGNREYAPALTELALARRALPNNSDVFYFTALVERRQGHWHDATHHLEQALALDPRSPIVAYELAINHNAFRHYADAASLVDSTLAWNPDDFATQTLRAEIDMYSRASLTRMQSVAAAQAANDPDRDRALTAALSLALRQRDYRAAEQALAASTLGEFNATGYVSPREFFEGLVARRLGDPEKAHTAFLLARERAAAAVNSRPHDGKALIILAEVDACLGRKNEAIAEGEHAAELLSVAKDAVDGPVMLARLAAVFAQIGETDRALDVLETAAPMPLGPIYGMLQLEEAWDSLRGEPRFAHLLASLDAAAQK